MNIAVVLSRELEAAAADLEGGCDRAADAATAYIKRRLQQLERRFPRHKFIYSHRAGCGGLYVFPAVNRNNSVAGLLTSLFRRSTRWQTMRSLHAVSQDIDRLAYHIGDRFYRHLGMIGADGPTVPRLAFKDRAQGDLAKAYDNRMADCLTALEKRFNRRCGPRTR